MSQSLITAGPVPARAQGATPLQPKLHVSPHEAWRSARGPSLCAAVPVSCDPRQGRQVVRGLAGWAGAQGPWSMACWGLRFQPGPGRLAWQVSWNPSSCKKRRLLCLCSKSPRACERQVPLGGEAAQRRDQMALALHDCHQPVGLCRESCSVHPPSILSWSVSLQSPAPCSP